MKCAISLVKILAVVIGLGISDAQVTRNCIEDQVLKLLTKWQKGDVSSLPSLEVIRLQSVDGEFEELGVKITYTTGDMQLAGVSKFIVEGLSVNANNLNVSTTIHFPRLTLTSENYSLEGRAYVIYPLKGSGQMKAVFRNVKITAGTKLLSKGSAMRVDDVDLSFSVRKIQVNLEDSSWPMNEVLNTSGLLIVELYRRDIVSAVKAALKRLFNTYLATKMSSQLLEIARTNYCTSSLQSALGIL